MEEILVEREHEAGFHTTAPSGKTYLAWKFSKICSKCYELHNQRKGRFSGTSEENEKKLESYEIAREMNRDLSPFK